MSNSRREFVIKSALGLAALSNLSNGINAAGSPKIFYPDNAEQTFYPQDAGDEPVSRVTLFSKALQELSYTEMILHVAEAGFDGIDLTVRAGGHVLPENVKRDLPLAVEAAKKSGLEIYLLTTDVINATDKYSEDILKTASSLGIKAYRTGRLFYDEKKSMPQNLTAFKAQIKKLAALNKKYKIRGEYQNHSGAGFGAPVWDIWEVIKDLDSRWMGVQYDVFHATVEGANSWPLGFNLIQPFIGSVDLKDFYWKKEDDKWEPSLVSLDEGMVDFKRFFSLLKKSNRKRIFSIHCEYLTAADEITYKLARLKKDLATARRFILEAAL
jgi:sugar phosphate isomerase/epimerase